jgi:hypothetical protein
LNGAPTADPDETRDNWVHHNTINTQGAECVDIKEAATANLVENNFCSGVRDSATGALDSRGNGNIFRYNKVFSNLSAGVRLPSRADKGPATQTQTHPLSGAPAFGIPRRAA